jgi:mannosylglycerate hydrolase
VEVLARLAAGVDRADVEVQVDNLVRAHRLRVLFPTSVRTESAAYDGPFEVVRRSMGLPHWDETWVEQPRPERPQRRWVDVSDGEAGLMIANRGLPEVEVRPTADGSEIALTLMRCVGWLSRDDFPTRRGHAGPALETPGAQMPGRHAFAYSIIPHGGGWEQAYRRAQEFDRPMRAVAATLHRGQMPSSASLVRAHGGEFLVTAVKQAERGGALVVRGVNLGATPARVHLRPWKRFGRSQLARMDETALSNLSLRRDGTVEVDVRPSQVVTLLFSNPASRTRR